MFDAMIDPQNPYVLAVAAPILAALGWAAWKLLRRAAAILGRALIIDPMKLGLNEVIDERIEQPLKHVHECFEKRTDEMNKVLATNNADVQTFMEESREDRRQLREGGAHLVDYGTRERERLWTAVAQLADALKIPNIRPQSSLDDAAADLPSQT